MKLDELYKLLKKPEKEEEEIKKVFKNPIEFLLVSSIIAYILNHDAHLLIYEVENFENLFDYADLFLRLGNLARFPLFNIDFKIITETSYPHELELLAEVEDALASGYTPLVAYFAGDFIPSQEAGATTMRELLKILSMALFKKVCYVILFTTNKMILYDNIPYARYGILIRDIAPRIIAEYFPNKKKYASSIGFLKLMEKQPEEIQEYIRTRKLPAPHTIEPLERDIDFKSLILPESLKEFIRLNIINPLKHDMSLLSSILLIGPAGSGKTTIAYTIARELGIPANVIRVELMGSKWMGESIAPSEKLVVLDKKHGKVMFVRVDEFHKMFEPDRYAVLAYDTDYRVRFLDVKDVVKHISNKRFLRIKTRLGREITVTDDHSLFTVKNGEIVTIKAGELKKGDSILLAGRIYVEPTKQTISEEEAENIGLLIAKRVEKSIESRYVNNERIPDFIMIQPENVVRSFLKGLFSGIRNTQHMEFRTTSEILAYQVLFLLHRLGYIPKLIKRTNNRDTIEYRIIIPSAKQGFEDRIEGKPVNNTNNTPRTKVEEALLNKDLVLDEVVSIEEEQHNESYDLVVPPTENFITINMVVAHNTEKIANQTLLLLNDRSPTVGVFRDAELILGERSGAGEESMVFERVRAIISSWLRSPRRRFFAVFTISDPRHIPEYILYDATFGVFKLPILPPLNTEDRKALLSLFLRKLANRYNLYFDPLKPSVEEALYTVAEETWAFTPREIQDIAITAINIAKDKGSREITKEIIQLARKFKEIDRVARVEIMKETVKACKKVGIPEPLLVEIYKFEEEVERLKARAYAEESKKRSIVKLSR